MIGIYDYTVLLTYLSAASASIGILVSLSTTGHPYIGVFFLMFCGLCDAFDGKVARKKKDRTELSQKFGIQIDSLSDIIAFGILPVCIGTAMIRVHPIFQESIHLPQLAGQEALNCVVLYAIMIIYVIAGISRLAYYNVTEEERQKVEEGNRKYFEGLPITSAALIFPTLLLIQYISGMDITILYFAVMLLCAVAFVAKIKIPKPGTRGIMIMIVMGLIEFLALLVCLLGKK